MLQMIVWIFLPARDDIDMMKIQRCFIRDESDLMVLVESYDGYWN